MTNQETELTALMDLIEGNHSVTNFQILHPFSYFIDSPSSLMRSSDGKASAIEALRGEHILTVSVIEVWWSKATAYTV